MVKGTIQAVKFFVDRNAIIDFVQRLRTEFKRPGRLFLIGETSQVLEGWRDRADEITFTAQIASKDRPAFVSAVENVQNELGIELVEEHPGDLIPLPAGFQTRAHRVSAKKLPANNPAVRESHLKVYHFDPYSVSFRYIARGDEPDYHIVLYYLQHGWVTMEKMESMLEKLLPEFSLATIAQDPAEFRRKYKGLQQMWRAISAGVTHRPTSA